MTITVHHLEHSQSFRIVWLLEELGMDYELKLHKRTSPPMAPSEYKSISPTGTAPVITITTATEGDEDKDGVDAEGRGDSGTGADDSEKQDEDKDGENKDEGEADGKKDEGEADEKKDEGEADEKKDEGEGGEEKEKGGGEENKDSSNKEKKKEEDVIALSESNAIIEYILDMAEQGNNDYPPLRPIVGSSDEEERRNYLFWFHASQGSLQPLITMHTLFRTITTQAPWPVRVTFNAVVNRAKDRFVKPRLEKLLGVAETQFEGMAGEGGGYKEHYLSGPSFSAADITAIYSFEAALTRYPDILSKYPKCQEWLDQMYDRPKFKAAQQKVGETYVVLSLRNQIAEHNQDDDDD